MKSCKPIFYNDDIESLLTFKNLHKTTRESFYCVYICVCVYIYIYILENAFIVRVCVSICVYILKNAKIESFYRANIKIESFHCACVCICVYILKNAKTNKNFTATNLQIMVVMNEIVLIITL